MYSVQLKAKVLTLFIFVIFIGIWYVSTINTSTNSAPPSNLTQEQIEYQKLMGKDVGVQKTTGFPSPIQMAQAIGKQLSNPFYDNGPNDKGIAIQLGYSLLRVGIGFLLASIIAIPLGFVIGMSPLLYKAFDPFIQILKPISPLAWMPIALYTIKDSSLSGIFVIFICSVWPMLINTAFGVSSVKRDWLNVAMTLEVSPLRKAFQVILPAAAPTILTGMRISMGIAWLVIVAAEMLVGGTGVGYFLWNEWNNLSLTSVLFAVLIIGVVGMLLDMAFAQFQKWVTYVE